MLRHLISRNRFLASSVAPSTKQSFCASLQQQQQLRPLSIGIDFTCNEATCCFFPKNHDVESMKPPVFACSLPLPPTPSGGWDYPREATLPKAELTKVVNHMIQQVREKNKEINGSLAEQEPIESVVLNVPTGFSELQRQSVLRAWRNCDQLPQLRKVLVDASSAALAYDYFHSQNEGKLITIHLDESSFSVAVAEVVYGVASIEDTDGVIHFRNYEMSEDKYLELLTKAVVDRVKHSLEVVGATLSDVTHIILSGSLMSNDRIKNQLLGLFANAEQKVVNIDNVMATGAAVQAAILDGIVDNLILLNAMPEAITVGVKDDKYISLANKNSVYPLTHTKKFKSPEDQPHVHISIYQGQLMLGQVTFDNVAKDTEFDVTLDVDANGDMNATIVNLATNQTVELPLDGSTLSDMHECHSLLVPVMRQDL